ncbi:MAG: UDP-N-acetylglucosamine 2-epimerase (non-hydrolyzing) [SAR116 cluster bacterium]|nr:UDP-N-acetylglucosamine 2-epimerase (non-hydrolyzing) [SAR116 cluster bacterium]RPH08564.1 MAG: UDP-N-acetylglucosamine 2-epimerase (non-hydrolyzing) [Alphaproteobacteria bacterium TMED54]
MYKVMTIVGTRPELIKMCRVIAEFDKHTEHVLVHTGQNYDYELNEVFFKDLSIRKPNYFLNSGGVNSADTIGNVIKETDKVLKKEKPDAVLLYGDTNSCLSVISAKRNKIPVFHMEAGNRCFDERVPEEINRKIVDHLSDINLVLTEHARRYLIREGISQEKIFKTGSHIPEVLDFYKKKISNCRILDKLNLIKNQYFVVSMHREENVDHKNNLAEILNSLKEIATKFQKQIIVSTHPRTEKRLKDFDLQRETKYINFLKPLGFFDYINLQMNAKLVISDSGTITEEASILNFPAITIRNVHERPEGFDKGTLIMTGLNHKLILMSIDIMLSQHDYNKSKLIDDYNEKNVSQKLLKIVLSYIDYVKKNTWKINL